MIGRIGSKTPREDDQRLHIYPSHKPLALILERSTESKLGCTYSRRMPLLQWSTATNFCILKTSSELYLNTENVDLAFFGFLVSCVSVVTDFGTQSLPFVVLLSTYSFVCMDIAWRIPYEQRERYAWALVTPPSIAILLIEVRSLYFQQSNPKSPAIHYTPYTKHSRFKKIVVRTTWQRVKVFATLTLKNAALWTQICNMNYICINISSAKMLLCVTGVQNPGELYNAKDILEEAFCWHKKHWQEMYQVYTCTLQDKAQHVLTIHLAVQHIEPILCYSFITSNMTPLTLGTSKFFYSTTIWLPTSCF